MKAIFCIGIFILSALSFPTGASARTPAGQEDGDPLVWRRDREFVQDYITPSRVVLTEGSVTDIEKLLQPYAGQVCTTEPLTCKLKSVPGKKASILLDFGKELHGGIQVVRAMSGSHDPARFRICFGESVTEALSDVRAEGSTATNDHAVRDFDLFVPWLGAAEYGNTGFRFVRLDLLDEDSDIQLVAVRAVAKYRDMPYLGRFSCSDERLDKIWQTGAYTVHLNMQDYLWDGIKRDRLVWMGDLNPEIMTANAVFGDQKVIQKSLDYVRDCTPPDQWMNGIASYSLWWIINQRHLYWYYADMDYLKEQHGYLAALVPNVLKCFDGASENFESRFLDHPTINDPVAVHAGLQAISAIAMDAAGDMARWLGDHQLMKDCRSAARRLRGHLPDPGMNKQAAALLCLADMMKPEAAMEIITRDGAERFTSFMGYYLIEAMAKAGRYEDAMKLISAYWGGMLDLGATTFWEDFNYADSKNAARIDEVVPKGKFDIHADGGISCYVGLRHSFCHGWASGPTAWMSEHVLGIEILEPGFRKVRINPHLGNLKWVKGAFPTPLGLIEVSHTLSESGTIVSDIHLPDGMELVK